MTPGLFITFEGIDGAGKSSHIEAAAQALRAQGRRVRCTREPGGTPLGEKLRDLALHEPMDALTEALIMFAARREHIVQVIRPALAAGEVVLCDRFTDATFAYQGGGRGFDWGTLQTLEGLVQGQGSNRDMLQPHLTLWFDLAPEIAAQRLANARIPDKFEAQPVAFFKAVANGYGRRAAADATRFARIDAAQPIDTVRAHVLAALHTLMGGMHE